MVKLVAEDGRWATNGNEMIFSNVVWCGEDEVNMYHLIDKDGNDLKVDVRDYIVKL